jgi:hypothetical protein
MTPQEIAEKIDVELTGWDIVEVRPGTNPIALVICENEYGDELSFYIRIERVEFKPGPPRKEDFEPDRIEPGEGESPW